MVQASSRYTLTTRYYSTLLSLSRSLALFFFLIWASLFFALLFSPSSFLLVCVFFIAIQLLFSFSSFSSFTPYPTFIGIAIPIPFHPHSPSSLTSRSLSLTRTHPHLNAFIVYPLTHSLPYFATHIPTLTPNYFPVYSFFVSIFQRTDLLQ